MCTMDQDTQVSALDASRTSCRLPYVMHGPGTVCGSRSLESAQVSNGCSACHCRVHTCMGSVCFHSSSVRPTQCIGKGLRSGNFVLSLQCKNS